jgi:hypothetical protein
LKSVEGGNFSEILLLLKWWQYSYLAFFAHGVSFGANHSSPNSWERADCQQYLVFGWRSKKVAVE